MIRRAGFAAGVLFASVPVAAQTRPVARPTLRLASVKPVVLTAQNTRSTTGVGAQRQAVISAGDGAAVVAPVTLPVVSGAPLTLEQLLNPAPGFGFDFVHLEAINRGLAMRALIDPVTQQTLALVRGLPQVTPLLPVGFATTPVVVVEPATPPVVVVQSPAAAAVAAPPSPPSPAPPTGEAAPVPDIGNFLFVLRDGTTAAAVAFAIDNDRIVYISPEGARRTLPLSALDRAATLARNAERGTTLLLPQ